MSRPYRRMLTVVKNAADVNEFYETTERNRQLDGVEEKEERDLPPVFNKRLFVTQGAVIITKEARRIMARNTRCSPAENPTLTKSEMLTMRSVVNGLKLIHKGQDYIKNVLSRCVTLETYNAFQYVKKKYWEDMLSCYYIVHGAVEVTYDMSAAGQSSSRNVYQPNIIYSHGTGEYLGIVSAEGRDEDIAPPATVYTKELCEFIRIDRGRFHRLIEVEESILMNEIQRYFISGSSILSILAEDVQAKLLQMIQKHVRWASQYCKHILWQLLNHSIDYLSVAISRDLKHIYLFCWTLLQYCINHCNLLNKKMIYLLAGISTQQNSDRTRRRDGVSVRHSLRWAERAVNHHPRMTRAYLLSLLRLITCIYIYTYAL